MGYVGKKNPASVRNFSLKIFIEKNIQIESPLNPYPQLMLTPQCSREADLHLHQRQ